MTHRDQRFLGTKTKQSIFHSASISTEHNDRHYHDRQCSQQLQQQLYPQQSLQQLNEVYVNTTPGFTFDRQRACKVSHVIKSISGFFYRHSYKPN